MMWIKSTLIFFTFLIVSSCGYHLRGTIELPDSLKSIYLQGASPQLRKVMKNTLRSSNGKLVDNIQLAGIVVNIDKETMRRRTLSLSVTGRVNEFELYYVLNFILLDADQNILSEKQTIEISKDYFNDQSNILGKEKEEQIIRDEIYRQVVQSIINRARVVLERKNKNIN